jgi:threonine aldolase
MCGRKNKKTSDLENYCTSLLGKGTGLLLFGTMDNQFALRSLLVQPPPSSLRDNRSHIFRCEAGGLALLTSAMVAAIAPRNGLYLTLEDIQANFRPGGGIIACPAAVISLENTLHEAIQPLDELCRISHFVRGYRICMHCDGAWL